MERGKKLMGTTIRPEISENNKYWISKHRYYELKHFCLQYPLWKKMYTSYNDPMIFSPSFEERRTTNIPVDPTSKYAMEKLYYADRIELIERIAKETDSELHSYILRAVTEGLSYTYLKTKLEMPCGRDMYYDRYRRFFWLLSNSRN